MTYKSIVKNMIRREASTWVQSVLEENGIEYKEVYSSHVENIEENEITFHWTAVVSVTLKDKEYVKLSVGGGVNDVLGVFPAWIENERERIIWASEEESRERMGIKDFSLER